MILGLILAACSIPVSTSVDSEVQVAIDIDRSCTGGAEVEEGASTSSYTLTAEGELCRIEVSWAGHLADQASLDAKVEEALEGRPVDRSDVTITAATLHLEKVDLVNEVDNALPIDAYPSWTMDLQIGGASVYSSTGTDVPALLDGPTDIPLPESAVAALDDAVKNGTPVDGAATATLLVPLAALPETPVELTLQIEGEVDLDAEIKAL